jgi:hypothetical protein
MNENLDNKDRKVDIKKEGIVFIELVQEIKKAVFSGFREKMLQEIGKVDDNNMYKLIINKELQTKETCLVEAAEMIKQMIATKLWELKKLIVNYSERQDKIVISGETKRILYGEGGNQKFEDSTKPSLFLLIKVPGITGRIIEDVETMVNIYEVVAEKEN